MDKFKTFGFPGIIALFLAFVFVPAFASNGLVQINASGFRTAYALNGALPSGFRSVYVAPVRSVSGDDRLDRMSARDQKTMQDYLRHQLQSRLGSVFSSASGPSAGVLVVEAAFTTLQSNRVTHDQAGENPNIDVGKSIAVGRAGVEITLRDGGSGNVLATFADEESGLPIEQNPNTDSLWGDAMQISRQWADDLASLLSGH